MRRLILVSAIVLVCAVALVANRIGQLRLGRQKLNALLKGDTSVAITLFSTKDQQRQLQCTDKDVLSYLTDALRNRATPHAALGSYSYQGYFTFKDGGSVEVVMRVGTNGLDLCADSYSLNPDQTMTHSLSATPADPARYRQLLTFLAEPHATAAGSALTIDDGQPTRREDRAAAAGQ